MDFLAALAFLEALAGERDPQVWILSLPEGPNRGAAGGPQEVKGKASAVLGQVSNTDRGVFFTVNALRPGASRRTAENVEAFRAVFIDDDQGRDPASIQWHKRPDLIVKSGGGFHAYWLIDGEGVTASDWTAAQKALAARYGTDPKVCDPPRVMRLPGSTHWKTGKGIPVTWTDLGGENLRTLGEVVDGLSLDAVEPANRWELPPEGSRIFTKADAKDLARKARGIHAEIMANVVDGNRPTIDPVLHAGKVDDLLTRHFGWLAGKVPDADPASVARVYLDSWKMLEAADRSAGRATYTVADLEAKIRRALTWIHEERRAALERAPVLGWVERGAEGEILGTVTNLALLLEHFPDWAGVLGMDDRARRKVYKKAPPWIGKPWAAGVERGPGDTIPEGDFSLMAVWLLEELGIGRVGKAAIWDAIDAVVSRAGFDPFRDWLLGLTWDGTPRLERWLVEYMGAEDSPYVRAVGPRWIVGAVARAMTPGAKMDEMIVLEGPQGVGKSRALRALAGAEYFSDSLPRGNGDVTDLMSHLAGPVIIEIPEVDGIIRAREASEIKAFLSKQVDRYRPKYGREEIEVPRRCVFAGTTNETEWIVDATGGRRFWPVPVAREGRRINVRGLERDRAQIWAEAVRWWALGADWHLEAEDAAEAAAEAAGRVQVDPWTTKIEAWAASADPETFTDGATLDRVLSEALGIPASAQDMVKAKRAGHVLRALGWNKDHRKKGKRWFPPKTLDQGPAGDPW